MTGREGWIEWGGHRTWFRAVGDLGSGLDPLLCLHGGPGSTHHQGGMLALEHALSGFGGLTSLVLSSTLASAAEWGVEVKRLRDELPPDVLAVLDEHERAGTYDSPEYERAEAVLNARHFYRGATYPSELERMLPERGLSPLLPA